MNRFLKSVVNDGVEFRPVPRGTHVEWCSPDGRVAAGRSAAHPSFYRLCDGAKLPCRLGTLDCALKNALTRLSRGSNSAARRARCVRHR
jgi:hypothetical protein